MHKNGMDLSLVNNMELNLFFEVLQTLKYYDYICATLSAGHARTLREKKCALCLIRMKNVSHCSDVPIFVIRKCSPLTAAI